MRGRSSCLLVSNSHTMRSHQEDKNEFQQLKKVMEGNQHPALIAISTSGAETETIGGSKPAKDY